MTRSVVTLSVLLMLCAGLAEAPHARAATLSIAPAETTVTIGEDFTLRVLVDAVPDLKGADLVYGYTAGRLAFLSSWTGDAIAGAGGDVFEFVYPDVTAPPDSVWYDAARLSDTGSGPGVVVFLRFHAATQGNGTVDCLSTDLRDSLNAPLSPTCAGALVHVVGPVPVLRTGWGLLKAMYR